MSTALRRALPWLALVAVGIAAVAWRFLIIEPPVMAERCGAAGMPAWCAWRQWSVLAFLGYGYGYAALVAAFGALWWRGPGVAWLATALGVVAMTLYCAEAGALALLVGGLRLLRAQAGEQDRTAQREIQAQP